MRAIDELLIGVVVVVVLVVARVVRDVEVALPLAAPGKTVGAGGGAETATPGGTVEVAEVEVEARRVEDVQAEVGVDAIGAPCP